MVSVIPNFDPTRLPFWDTYVREGKADTIQVGGTMAGEFTGMSYPCEILLKSKRNGLDLLNRTSSTFFWSPIFT
jgi:hypothetical protein